MREQIELLHSQTLCKSGRCNAALSLDPFLQASGQQVKLKCSLSFSFQIVPCFLRADTQLQPVHHVSPPEVFQKHSEGKSAEQSNRDKRKQLNFFTYFSAPKVPALKSMNLFRANTAVNDRKLFKVNVFKATEM